MPAGTWFRNPIVVRRALAVMALAILLPLSWLGPLDHLAKDSVEAGLKRALITFAAARAANAVISVLQETTVSLTPGGLGITSAPGQVLDPINDLIEQFSSLMLAASISLGVQLLLVNIGGATAVSAVVTVALLAWAAFMWLGRGSPHWMTRILVLILFLRFGVPFAALGSELAFRSTLENEYAQAQAQVEITGRSLLGLSTDPKVNQNESMFERARRWLLDERQSLVGKLDEIKANAEKLVRHVITLAAVFLVQTMLLPLLFMWLGMRILRMSIMAASRPNS